MEKQWDLDENKYRLRSIFAFNWKVGTVSNWYSSWKVSFSFEKYENTIATCTSGVGYRKEYYSGTIRDVSLAISNGWNRIFVLTEIKFNILPLKCYFSDSSGDLEISFYCLISC